jgi:hypothetical protein
MGSENQGHSFDPLDLEILDRVYEVARAHIEARDLYCDPEPEDTRRRRSANRCSAMPVAIRSISTWHATRWWQA